MIFEKKYDISQKKQNLHDEFLTAQTNFFKRQKKNFHKKMKK